MASNTKETATASLSFINQHMLPQVNGNYLPSTFLGGGDLSKFTSATWPTGTTGFGDAAKFYYELFATAPSTALYVLKSTLPLTGIIMNSTASSTSYSDYVAPAASGANVLATSSSTSLVSGLLDINLYTWIDQSTDASAKAFAGFMQRLYLIHDLFLPANWAAFKEGSTVYLQGFNTAGTCFPSIQLAIIPPTGATVYNVLASVPAGGTTPYVLLSDLSLLGGERFPLLDMSTTTNLNTLLIRRLLFLWIRMANYQIATAAGTPAAPPAVAAAVPIIKQACYMLLSQANDNVDIGTTNGRKVNTAVLTGLADKQHVMRTTAGILSQMNSDLLTYQTSAQKSKNDIVSEQAFKKKVRIVEYVSLGILVMVFAASAFLAGSFAMDPTLKLKASLGVFLAAAFSVAVIVLVYQSKLLHIESFADNTIASGVQYSSGDSTGFVQNVSIFLSNTITLSNSLDSYDLATNMNKAMFNDSVKYTNTTQDIVVAGRRLQDMAKTVEVEKAQHNSFVYLFLTLTMVLAVMLPIYVWAANAPTIRMGIMVLSGAVAFMALLVHAFESTSIVRTDGQKKYWGQPAQYASTV